jgi:hypothetical protein
MQNQQGQNYGNFNSFANAMTQRAGQPQGQPAGNQDRFSQVAQDFRQRALQQFSNNPMSQGMAGQQGQYPQGMNPMIRGLLGQSMQMKPGNYGNRTLPPDVAEALKKKLMMQQNPTPESQVQVPGQDSNLRDYGQNIYG